MGKRGGASSREPLVVKGRMGTWVAATLMSAIQAHHEHNRYTIKLTLSHPSLLSKGCTPHGESKGLRCPHTAWHGHP